MSKRLELTGQRFGRLIALNYSHTDKGRSLWNCRCDCGNTKVIRTNELRVGKTSSCGCFQKEFRTARLTTHGMKNTRLYNIWRSMKSRCNNSNAKEYKYYGGRGITYTKRWEDFANFHEDMHETYQEHLTLDRINFNGNYEKGNCRWVTMAVQSNNSRKCVFIEINGEVDTVKNMCRKYNAQYHNVSTYIRKGRDPWEMIQKYRLT